MNLIVFLVYIGYARYLKQREIVKFHAFLFNYQTMRKVFDQMLMGSLIREELKTQKRSVTWFAKKIAKDRTHVYWLFKKQHVEPELLFRISVILKTDFFTVYSKLFNSAVNPKSDQNE